MLGFEVYIFPKSHYIADPKVWEREERWKHLLAAWSTGLGGLKWIDDLVKKGEAIDLNIGGEVLLCLYGTKLSTIKHVLKGNIPKPDDPPVIGEDYTLPSGFIGDVEIHESRIAECSEDEEIIIEAWDQS